MRVIIQPSMLCIQGVSTNDGQDLTDLEPSKDDMQFRALRDEPPSATVALEIFHFAEPTEKQEQVTDIDPLIPQMALCSTVLAEGR